MYEYFFLIIVLPSYCYQAMAAIDKDEPGKKFWLHTRSGLGVHCHTYTVLFTIIIVCVYIVTMNIIVMVVLAASLSFSPSHLYYLCDVHYQHRCPNHYI